MAFRFEFYETLRDTANHHFTLQRTFIRLPRAAAHHRTRSKAVLGPIMLGKVSGAIVVVISLAQASSAQDLKPAPHKAAMRVAANHETFDASMARLAAKAAFQPSAQPTRQELLDLIVLMSLREQRPST
jgi:hypothetical protein